MRSPLLDSHLLGRFSLSKGLDSLLYCALLLAEPIDSLCVLNHTRLTDRDIQGLDSYARFVHVCRERNINISLVFNEILTNSVGSWDVMNILSRFLRTGTPQRW